MILEGIMTTTNEDGSANVSPMGPIVDPSLEQLLLRPFQTSTTYRNLKRTGAGVFHVTDDVLLFAEAAIGRLRTLPELVPAERVAGFILADACRWYAVEVASLDDRQERTEIQCRVVDQGRLRDFLGFNRAKHAVIEAAILATRLHLLPAADVAAQYQQLAVIVEKTAGPQERTAFALLEQFVAEQGGAR